MTVPTTTTPAANHRDPPALRDLDDVECWPARELTASAALGGGPGPARARHLLRMLGDPQDRVPVVHVAGTAGKGSVASFVAALLHAHGKAVGAHLSPHVHDLGERFRLGAGPAPGPLVAATLAAMRPVIAEMTASPWGAPTYFEVTNAVAFQVFADRAVDHALVETGARAAGIAHVEAEPDVAAALARAAELAPPGHPMIVAGSFHLVAAAGRVLADPGGTPGPEHGSEHGPRRQDGPGTVGRARGAGR